MYSATEKFYQKGDILIFEGDNANNIIFIERGLVAVKTSFEGNEFKLENLFAGSVINYRTFLLEDYMYIQYQCVTHTYTLELSVKTLNEILEKFQDTNEAKNFKIY